MAAAFTPVGALTAPTNSPLDCLLYGSAEKVESAHVIDFSYTTSVALFR
jgi:hypothetical protein